MTQDANTNSRAESSAASDQEIQAVHADLLHAPKEPNQGYSLMPLFILGFVSTMIFVVAIYFIHNRGGLTDGLALATTIQHPGFDPGKHMVEAPTEVDAVAVGERLYNSTCATCHMPTGTGVPAVYPPLAGSEWVTNSEERVIRIVLHGLTGPIEVAGQSFAGAVPMPAFGAGSSYNWDDARISYVLTYIRQAWGNEAGEITPEQVTAVREAVSRSSEWTAAELLEIE